MKNKLLKKEKIWNYKIELKQSNGWLSIIAYKWYDIDWKIHYTIFQWTHCQNDILYWLTLYYSFCNDIVNQIYSDKQKPIHEG
jgi:hypothetical protein